jgi:histidinol dehydrogenase
MIGIYETNKASKDDIAKIMRRAQANVDEARDKVIGIIAAVRKDGDAALVRYTKEWDDPTFTKDRLVVTKKDIQDAYKRVPKTTTTQIKDQIALSTKFHKEQRKRIADWDAQTEPGIRVGEKWTPMGAVGLYVPGGKNPFPTVAQILAVPAKIAGCPRIAMCISPKGETDEVLIAADMCGVSEIYRIGGAQAIAALAYGTQTIKPVELVAGPGNPFVTMAKILCQERIAIDMPAGPSEAIMLADESLADGMTMEQKAAWCAADILARAEHGPDSAGVLVTDSKKLAQLTKEEVKKQFAGLTRQDYVRKALATYSAIVVTRTWDEAIAFTNDYAPEHLEILTTTPDETFARIVNAGSVFLGLYNPVALNDYATGVNHILPTGGWAKRSSPVAVWTYMKRVQYSQVTLKAVTRLWPIVKTIAEVEGLDAHWKSVGKRIKEA